MFPCKFSDEFIILKSLIFVLFSLSTVPGTASELQGYRDESIQVILQGYRWRKEPGACQILPGNLRAQVSYLRRQRWGLQAG